MFAAAGRLAIGCFPSTETIVDVFGVNFFAAVQLTNLLLPHFKQKGSGHIVFTNSSSGLALLLHLLLLLLVLLLLLLMLMLLMLGVVVMLLLLLLLVVLEVWASCL